ncbi:MAG: hypothetical protein HY652_09690 [Acidobacteria bacterium]|nr:hypothetical protein [Acidobacteriota bacterium]
MNYFLQALGAFFGVLAGTAVTILVGLYFQRRNETQQTRNLKFELELDIKKIETWLEEIQRYRNAVNGDSLHTYFGYFDLSRIVSVTANAMFQSGLLHKKLSHDQIGKLQVIFSEFSVFGEQYFSNQLSQTRKTLEQCRAAGQMDLWHSEFKPQAVANVDF